MTSDLDLAAAERPEPAFGPEFRAQFAELLAWRRDVRRFRRDPLPDGLLERLLELAELAPSVGLSRPWRFVRVVSDDSRARVRANSAAANATALCDYSGTRAAPYARLQPSHLEDAPGQAGVFAADDPAPGTGLGKHGRETEGGRVVH